jgi:hypothetical protein
MSSNRIIAAFAIGASLAAAMDGSASTQTAGQIFAFHSQPAGDCPELDWYLVVRENGKLLGVVAWNDMSSVARLSGTIDAKKSFHMDATAIGVTGRTVAVDGHFGRDGWITANIKGADIDCKNIRVPLFRPMVQKA